MKKLLFGLALIPVFAGSGLGQVPGAELWHVIAPETIISSPAIGADGTIYVGTAGSLCSFSPQGGTNWVLNFSKGIRSSPSIGPDGRIYAASQDGLMAIVSASGTYSTVETGGYIYASPAIGSDGTVYVCSISNLFNKLFALTPDGAVKWVFNMTPLEDPGQFWSMQASSPAIGPDGTIYVGSRDMNLYAITPGGATNWVFPLAAPTYASPAIGPDGIIYLGADNGIAYAINPDGTAKWKVQLCDRWIESSAVVSTDGTVYFATSSAQVFALDSNGNRKWVYRNPFDSWYTGSPALASDGSIYIANTFGAQGPLHAISPWGTNLWTYYTYKDSVSSPAIGGDGTIYTASGSWLYALYGTNGLMRSSWPMFRGNAAHTARVIQRRMSTPRILPDGNCSFNVAVEPGHTYQLEGSTDGLDWGVLTNFVSETCTGQVADLTATNSQMRLYRLRATSF